MAFKIITLSPAWALTVKAGPQIFMPRARGLMLRSMAPTRPMASWTVADP